MISWHSTSERDVIKALKTRRSGLTNDEATERLKEYGYNTLPETKRKTIFGFILEQFENPFVAIMLIAAGITFWLKDPIDAFVILLALTVNIFFGFFQEWKSDRTIEALKAVVKYEAYLVRDNELATVPADQVSPGDILILRSGERVLADARIIEADMLEISEAILTGETTPVKKVSDIVSEGAPVPDRTNMAYAGTIVNRGEGLGVVVATGVNTQAGGIAQSLVELEETLTPLQQRLQRLANVVAAGIIFLAIAVFVSGLIAGVALVEIFSTAVAIAIAAIPAELVVAVTIILTVGMRRLLDRKALIRKLVAAETLGSVNHLCVDKTGTLTEGIMQVADFIIEGTEKTRTQLLRAGIFCNEAQIEPGGKILGETTDVALMHAAREAGLSDIIALRKDRILDIFPFESINRYMAALVIEEDGTTIYVKGAAEKILPEATMFMHKDVAVPMQEHDKERLLKKHDELSAQGFRLLALAFRTVPTKNGPLHLGDIPKHLDNITFIGFAVIEDPLRPSAKESLHKMKKAGVRVSILTGDHVLTAQTIATKLGIFEEGQKVMNGESLENMSDDAFRQQAKDIGIYARVLPHQKLRIVSALQEVGEVVAMTGDGINDAPALKKSDIGIAVGGAADVAKEAADIVLLDSNFETILEAIKEGRVIFDNIRKATLFLLIDSLGEVVLVGGYLFLSMFGILPVGMLPLVAGQILWINLAEDSLPNFALAFEKGEKDVMERPPTSRTMSIIDRTTGSFILGVSLTANVLLLVIFVWLIKQGMDIERARTIMFAASGIDSLFYILSVRTLNIPIWRSRPWENPWMLTAVLSGVGLMLAAIYLPFLQPLLHTVSLGIADWTIILIYLGFAVLMFEFIKILMGFIKERRGAAIK